MKEQQGSQGLHIDLAFGRWVRVGDPDVGVIGYVRFDPAPDGRLAPSAILAQAYDHDAEGSLRVRALRGADLREFPLAAVEAAANGELRDKLLERQGDRVEVVFRFGDGTVKHPRPPRPRVRPRKAGSVRLPLELPTTRPYPDEFYRDVAKLYAVLATYSNRPAADIANASDVPVKTVQRWVGEARKRGHLAPGRKGKAG